MNYNEILLNFINGFPNDEPILIEDIKTYFKKSLKITDNLLVKVMKTIYVYINRLVHSGVIKSDCKGVYYKPTHTLLGEVPLNKSKLIEKKYIKNGDDIKGYVVGPYLFNALGLNSQVPVIQHIVTNECPNRNEYKIPELSVVIRNSKIPITNDNYAYLQLIEKLRNKDKVKIEVTNKEYRKIIYEFVDHFELKLMRLFEIAFLVGGKSSINKLYELVSLNENG